MGGRDPHAGDRVVARLAIIAAGAVVGVGIALASGGTALPLLFSAASLGASVGAVAGQFLFPDKVKQEGSRLNDLAVSSSAFGAVRPLIYGQVRIGGNVIWATPIREQKSTTHSGKGGPSVSNTTYTYYGNFALAMCEGPVQTVIRVWADSKLIYDTTGSQLIVAPGVKFRFYPGDETQLPDSLIEADKGVGNVPGYRGTCYIVFEDLPLADYGNRLPNITCEMITVEDPSFPVQNWTQLDPTIFAGDTSGMQAMAVDWDRNLIYFQKQNPYGLVVADAISLRTIREKPMTEVLTAGDDGGFQIGSLSPNILIGPDGALYFVSSPGFIRVDQNTLEQTGPGFPTTGIFSFSSTQFPYAFYDCAISFFTASERLDFLVTTNYFGSWGVLSMPDLLHQAHANNAFVGVAWGIVSGKSELGYCDAWALWGAGPLGNPNFYITHIEFDGVTWTSTLAETLVCTDFDPAATIFLGAARGFLVYDESDDSLVIGFTTGVSLGGGLIPWAIKWSPTSGVVWKTDLTGVTSTIGPSSDISSQSRITQGTLAWWSIASVVQISTVTGAVTVAQRAPPTVPPPQWPIAMINSIQVYDSVTQIVLGYFNGGGASAPGGVAKAFINRKVGGHTTLGEIVYDQCIRAGFTDADIDTSALTDVIQGYVLSQRATTSDVINPLLGAFLCDAVESDFVLKFKHRADATVASIIQDELVRTDPQAEPYVETRQQEIELPMRLTLTYMDKDRDYQQNTAAVKRIRNPDPTVFSDNQIDLQLAMVSTSTPAKQMAEILLYTAWNQRHSFDTKLGPKYDYLDPGDAVQLTLDDGYTTRVRLASTSLGVDYSVETKLIAETDGQYVSFAEADPGVPWEGSHFIFAASKSKLILLDVPLLRDVDDLAGTAIRAYWGGGPYSTSGAWPGAVLQESVPGLTWETVDSVSSEMCWGYMDTPPEDWQPVFATQDELHGGIMVVGIVGGDFTPSTITDLEMANFGNPIAVVKSNGQVEVMQYRDAVALGGGRWQLSTLRRGQRGTDTMAFGHTSGEQCVFLNDALIDLLTVPLAQRNVSEFWRLVTAGMIPDDAIVEPFTFHARDLMPYAPINAERTLVGSDVVLTWIHRTRIGGLMVDGSDTVPLHEASEAYEAYLLATEADAVDFDPTDPATYTRAFTGLTSATLTYTAAMMGTDGFAPTTDTMYVVIYQLSAVVGRGFSYLHVLPPLGGLAVGLEDGSGEWAGWLWG